MAPDLPTAQLGRTGLEVTRLGFGTALSRKIDPADWDMLLNLVLDSGVNFIDTANCYGARRKRLSEEQIGNFISNRRSEYFLATKCGCLPTSEHVWTRENAFRALEESLRRLKTDYVDIMQLHNPTVEECLSGDLVSALQEMQDEGKVRWLGVSTTLPHLETFLGWGVFDTYQIPYSALEREHEELITHVRESGGGTIIRGGVAQGEPESAVPDREREEKWHRFEKANLDELRQDGETRTAFLLRYTLSHKFVDTTITSTTRADHWSENLETIGAGPLSQDVYTEAKRRLDLIGERSVVVKGFLS